MDQQMLKDLFLVVEKLDMKAKSLDFPKTILVTHALSNLNGLSLEGKFINVLISSYKTKKLLIVLENVKMEESVSMVNADVEVDIVVTIVNTKIKFHLECSTTL